MTVNHDRPDAVGPPSASDMPDHGHSHLGLALVVIATAQLMVLLDATIVNIALPSIQSALEFTSTNLTWVINGYTLAFGGLLLLGGRAGDLFGRRRVFIFGILLFTVASLLCGLATSDGFLIAARVLQGAGAAVASPTALALVTTTFPEGPPRNRAFAVYAAMSGAGAAVGLIAGGLLTDYLSWRWVFFVNIPIGVFIAAVAPRVLGESEPIHGRIDWLGAVTGTVGLTLLVYAITRTGTAGWSDPFTIGCFVLSALILTVFVLIEMKHEHPIMPLRLFRNRNRSGTYVVMLVVGAGLFASFYFLSLFVQGILGYSAVRAGLSFLPFTVGIVLGAGLASQLTPRVPPRVLVCVGLLMGTAGLLLNAQLDTSSSYLTGLLPPMIITSIGMGLVFVPLTLTAVSGVDHHESGIASALLNTVQQVGGSLGLAALATIAATASNNRFPGVERLIEQQQQQPTPTGPPTPEQLTLLAQVQDALTHGYTRAFLIGAVMMVLGLIVTAVLINAPKQQVRDGRAVPAG